MFLPSIDHLFLNQFYSSYYILVSHVHEGRNVVIIYSFVHKRNYIYGICRGSCKEKRLIVGSIKTCGCTYIILPYRARLGITSTSAADACMGACVGVH